ncbi:Rha family transcriptional regulator, partial [Sutterella wadsworthensis]|uniref:Rha family transcriptional regulator n=1 Tax=Sutterella wadsworthensis TaxID=40545 RepID=UPI003967D11C
MSQIIAANAFKVVEGRPVTSSRIVAEYFGKQHHHVVRDIRTLISQKPDLERNANFGECSETINLANGATRQVPFIWMDRKGFSLLAMGFT